MTSLTHRSVVRLALSRAEVALSIGVGVNTIDAMVAGGALPPPRKWQSERLWLVSEVEAYLKAWPSDGDARPERRLSAIDDRPFSVERLAKRWGCSENSIRHMVNSQELPAFRLGRLMRIPAQVVTEIEAQATDFEGSRPNPPEAGQASGSGAIVCAVKDEPPVIVLTHSKPRRRGPSKPPVG